MMDEFNYYSDDFLSNGGFQQLYSIFEYPEEICLWDSQSAFSQFELQNNNNLNVNFYQSNYQQKYEYGQNIGDSCDLWNSNCGNQSTISNSGLTQNDQSSLEKMTITPISSTNNFSSDDFIIDMDQWKLNSSNCNNITRNANNGTTFDVIEPIDFNLDNLLFDNDQFSAFDAPMPIDLPDKTFFCDDSCDSVLKESSENLNIKMQDFRPKSAIGNGTSKTTKAISKSTTGDEEKTFVCSFGECRKVYAKAGHLRAHIRRHIGDKPYVCLWPNCTWRFSRSDELSRHRRSHSGIKPYKCDYCTKCFSRSDHLTKHRKVHERKMAALKIKAVWTSLPQGRPGRRPKVLLSQQPVD